MTKEMLIEELKRIKTEDDNDEELNHLRADELLIAYINDAQVEDAFDSIFERYA